MQSFKVCKEIPVRDTSSLMFVATLGSATLSIITMHLPISVDIACEYWCAAGLSIFHNFGGMAHVIL